MASVPALLFRAVYRFVPKRCNLVCFLWEIWLYSWTRCGLFSLVRVYYAADLSTWETWGKLHLIMSRVEFILSWWWEYWRGVSSVHISWCYHLLLSASVHCCRFTARLSGAGAVFSVASSDECHIGAQLALCLYSVPKDFIIGMNIRLLFANNFQVNDFCDIFGEKIACGVYFLK